MKQKILILASSLLLGLAGCSNQVSSSNSNDSLNLNESSSQATNSSSNSNESVTKGLIIDAPKSLKLTIGDSLNLTCHNLNGKQVDGVIWSSSNPDVISIDESGFLKVLTSGSSDIKAAKDNLESDPLTFYSNIVPVESISLKTTPSKIAVGETIQLETSILPSEANQNIEISSSSDALRLDSKNKTIEALKETDEEITVKVFASKDFTKFKEFKLRVEPLDVNKKITVTFNTENYDSLKPLNVVKGSIIEKIEYDPFQSVKDKSSVNDIVFFGFYYDSSFVKPVTFPITSTYTNMTLYAKFAKLSGTDGSSLEGYNWKYELNDDGNGYEVKALEAYNVGSNTKFGIPAYHEGKPVISFEKLTTNDTVNKITDFALPNTLLSLPQNAMNYWQSLAHIYLPSDTKITSIPSYAFRSLKKLQSFYIPDSVTSIGSYAFDSNESLESIHLPASLETTGEYAFGNCASLEEINFASLKILGDYAFMGDTNLKRIHFPKNLEKLGNINIGIFMGVRDIERISVDPENPNYSNDDFGALYNKDKTVLYMAPNGRSMTNAYIPDTVTEIFDNAFTGSEAEFIKIPSSVKALKYGSFGRCMNLKGIYIPTSVTTIKDNIFSMSDTKKLTIYVGFLSTKIPSHWSSVWNQNTQYSEAEIMNYQTIYGFQESEFVF